MAAADVHAPHDGSSWGNNDDSINQDEGRLRASSTDSVDQELDWLIQNETKSNETQQNGSRQETSKEVPRSESRLDDGDDPNNKDNDINSEQIATDEGAAGDAYSSFDDDKESDEYYRLAAEQLLVQQELQKLKDEGIIPQSDEPVFDYDIAERVRQLNKELEEEGATPEKKNRRVNFSENLVEFSESPEPVEDNDAGKVGDEAVEDPNDLEVEKLTLNSEADSAAQDHAIRQRIEGSVDDPSASAGQSGARTEESQNGNELGQLQSEGFRRYDDNGATTVQSQDHQSHSQDGVMSRNHGSGTDEMDSGNHGSGNQLREGSESEEQKNKVVAEDQTVLLERNGKFELVNVQDLSAEEREMMGITLSSETNDNQNSNKSAERTPVKFQPSPPPHKQRPSTATHQSGVHRKQLAPRRIQSAKTHRDSRRRGGSGGGSGGSSSPFDWEARSSGYGLSPEQKTSMRRMYKMQLDQQREEQEKEAEEKRRAQEDGEQAFHYWLEKKKEDDKQKRKDERERRRLENDAKEFRDPERVFQAWVEKKRLEMKDEILRKTIEDKMKSQTAAEQESEKTDPEETYKAWLQNKKEQAKMERRIKQKMDEEKEAAYFVRDRKDCDKAFKEWLRSKNGQLKKDQTMKRSGAAYSQETARLSRKSRQLAKALQVAQAYRYTDYCGYRF